MKRPDALGKPFCWKATYVPGPTRVWQLVGATAEWWSGLWRQTPMSSDDFIERVSQMHRAGERLLSALAEEERLSALVCKSDHDEDLFGQWAKARHLVEQCREAYTDAILACQPYASQDPIQDAVESP